MNDATLILTLVKNMITLPSKHLSLISIASDTSLPFLHRRCSATKAPFSASWLCSVSEIWPRHHNLGTSPSREIPSAVADVPQQPNFTCLRAMMIIPHVSSEIYHWTTRVTRVINLTVKSNICGCISPPETSPVDQVQSPVHEFWSDESQLKHIQCVPCSISHNCLSMQKSWKTLQTLGCLAKLALPT